MYKYSGLQKSLRNTLFISCILYGTDGTPFSFTQHKCVTQIICSREKVRQESSILLILIALTCDTIIHVSKKKKNTCFHFTLHLISEHLYESGKCGLEFNLGLCLLIIIISVTVIIQINHTLACANLTV